MYKSFRAVIRRNQFIQNGDSLVAGVSGGVDSMVLASLLAQLRKDIPFTPVLAHVNYKLRGAESDAQEKLARDFAARHGLAFFSTNAGEMSLRDPDRGRGNLPIAEQNFQSAARDFRYHYFSEVASQIGAGKIAVAHHRDDQAETVLAQLLRGSSLKGLGGMRPLREMQKSNTKNQNDRLKIKDSISLIRPLLTFSKADLVAYACENDIPFIEDASNTSPKYWRNRLRHELLPVITALRPRGLQKIVRVAEEMRELSDCMTAVAAAWLETYSRREAEKYWMPRPGFAVLPKALRLAVLGEAATSLLKEAGELERDHLLRCDQIATGSKTEAFYCLPADLRFLRSGDNLLFKIQ